MAWKDKSSATFSGSSGQMAVMSELLHRKCNAAIPLVDVGTDVFAFRDDREEVARIQVKTARGQRYKNGKGYSARFGVPMEEDNCWDKKVFEETGYLDLSEHCRMVLLEMIDRGGFVTENDLTLQLIQDEAKRLRATR